MNFPFYIARRYLFSKKKHNAINIISGISVCGVALATLALVCTLSVFNGFQDMVASFFTAFDPQLKITVREGKVFDGQDKRIGVVCLLPEVDVFTETFLGVQEMALLSERVLSHHTSFKEKQKNKMNNKDKEKES